MERLVGILGVSVLICSVYLLSKDRGAVRWRQVAWGLALQVGLAVLILRVPGVNDAFGWISRGAEWFLSFGNEGARYLFGGLADDTLPVTIDGESRGVARLGGVIILKILPTIIFVSSAMSVLYHIGVLQRVVLVMSKLVRWVLQVSGAESLAATANVVMGMTEAPLLIRPYLPRMTSSELLAVMVGGFATISGSMMAVYRDAFGIDFKFLLAASILNAPAALYLTKIYLPETEMPLTLGRVDVGTEHDTVNVVDAAATGASTGLRLALNVGAMLLAFAAGLKLIDAALGWGGSFVLPEGQVLSLGRVLGWICYPLALLVGVPPDESVAVGQLLGTKIALNEFFAYQALSEMELTSRARGIATFALCGFANFGSIAIQLGGLGGLVPDRRRELARFGITAMLLGAVANGTSAAIAGVLVEF